MTTKSELYQTRLDHLKSQLGAASLVAVSKYSPASDAEIYYHLGQFDFGENRVSELEAKAAYFKSQGLDQVRWHFIGNLQRNKVKSLLQVPNLSAIHSIDRTELLDELIKHEPLFSGPTLDLYLEMNLGGEVQKHGFTDISTVALFIDRKKEFLPPRFRIKGLMTMAPLRTDDREAGARKCFLQLAECARVLTARFGQKFDLSMGMSGDFQWALSAGSDVVRVGSLLFEDSTSL